MGRDRAGQKAGHSAKRISIHSPRMGRDGRCGQYRPPAKTFQSTLPAWGETAFGEFERPVDGAFQSTLPAWGETALRPDGSSAHTYFNPLSPHGERLSARPVHPGSYYFNPLSPHGERHCCGSHSSPSWNFNPLSPHGERQVVIGDKPLNYVFQSTLPAWGETCSWTIIGWSDADFNPLSPHGERLEPNSPMTNSTSFQSTLPAWGETANAHNFSKRKTGASAQHCIFSPAKRFFLLTKNFLEKRNKPFFRCEPYRKTVGAPVSHQPLKN